VAVGAPVSVPLDESNGFDLNPNLSSSIDAAATLNSMDRKLDKLLTLRTSLGAAQSALESQSNNLAVTRQATTAAFSRIVDVDYATEVTQLTRAKMLQSSGAAICAQANAESSQLLKRLLIDGGQQRL
jgi:flagellin